MRETTEVTERILTLDGRRPMRQRDSDLITRKEARTIAEQIITAERVEYERMVHWYMEQIPGLVAKMLGDALALNGLVFKGPVDVAEVPAPDAGQSGEAAAPEPAVPAGDAA